MYVAVDVYVCMYVSVDMNYVCTYTAVDVYVCIYVDVAVCMHL